jgi:HAD superfamily hydrolase (TIGR01549 family)
VSEQVRLAGAMTSPEPSSDEPRPAVLFDIDGTLVDSNYLHVDAWDRALAEIGHPVDVWRIHRGIGMDSGKLLEGLLGDAPELHSAAKEEHARFYAESNSRLRPIAGARDLLHELARRDYQVVLATSAPQEELDALLDVLDVGGDVDAVTSGEDVETAKPDPDIIESALEKASSPASRAVMVGDAVWDMKAAARAGVISIGVLTGGYSREELLDAGATAVYDDVAELLAELDDSPIADLPASVTLERNAAHE